MFNHESDEIIKDKTILYLPKFAYFGDFQIFYRLKSNLVYKTLSREAARKKSHAIDHIPDVYFMCVSRDKLNDLCNLFPQTAENLKRKSLERRKRFMQQKNFNSKSYRNKDTMKSDKMNTVFSGIKTPQATLDEDNLDNFYSDEEYEDPNSQKEDMKTYLTNLNERIDNLVNSLMEAKKFVGTQTNERTIREQIEAREALADKDGNKMTVAEYFNSLVQQ